MHENGTALQSRNGAGFRAANAQLVDYEELRRLQLEVARLRRENAAMALQVRHAMTPGRIAQRATDDAMLLVGDFFAGQLVSREEMYRRHGMSRRRWEWARALLRYARCTDRYYRFSHINDPARIAEKLGRAVDRLLDAGSLDELKRHLPPGRRGDWA